MRLRSLERRLQSLKEKMPDPNDKEFQFFLQTAALERALESLPLEQQASAEAAIDKLIVLCDAQIAGAGFTSEEDIKARMTPEGWAAMQDLEARANALLLELRHDPALLARWRRIQGRA